MPEFENPYATKPSGARPLPGALAEQYASMIEIGMRLFGVTLYQHEHEGLAHVIGAFIRAFPQLKDLGKKPVDTVDGA